MAKKTTKAACPVCDKPMDDKYKPFCSRRCADVDLNRWLGETYRVPTDEPGIANDPYAEEG
ncbi:DNA gyrase inhibitor YacG [Aestuariispira ectoiniformans]|uniref:DNA gyrase inhibitor YacG n=1 Tax=Aestuariispira ectoiniformans TaxID=2775080 RepID=UPI00223C0ED2|nr:DNA gyrase inhibitor YacG [Aestuariispira ectoiniformans]